MGDKWIAKMTPTEKQALAYWLHASGMTSIQIGEHMGISAQAAHKHLEEARYKARCIGLQYTRQDTKPEQLGFSVMKQLAKEAGLV